MTEKLPQPDAVETSFKRLQDYSKIMNLACPFTVESKNGRFIIRPVKPSQRITTGRLLINT